MLAIRFRGHFPEFSLFHDEIQSLVRMSFRAHDLTSYYTSDPMLAHFMTNQCGAFLLKHFYYSMLDSMCACEASLHNR